jgi:hypothetical protein
MRRSHLVSKLARRVNAKSPVQVKLNQKPAKQTAEKA